MLGPTARNRQFYPRKVFKLYLLCKKSASDDFRYAKISHFIGAMRQLKI
jgi:hypothetical protein